MDIRQTVAGDWVIIHAGKEIETPRFASQEEAWGWADQHVDDQVHDGPNTFSTGLVYRDAIQALRPLDARA